MISTLRDYASSFFVTPFSVHGTMETIKIRIPKKTMIPKHEHQNMSNVSLEKLFTVGVPSIYCFTGTSLTFEDIIDIKSDLQEQLKFMENKGYSVSWLNVKRIYRINGHYVLLSNKDEIKNVAMETSLDIDSLVQKMLDEFISNEEVSML